MRILACAVLLTACSPAAVTAVCGQDLLTCSGVCTATSSDAHNCGACGHACAATEICTGGHCELPACQADLVRCSGVCVDVGTDEANCGGCGHACAVHEVCSAGACALTCQSPLANCNGACVDLADDSSNCGSCSHSCGGNVCSGGQCGAASGCGVGLAPCGGVCVDVQTSNANCGACGHACGSAQSCSSGTCTCPSGGTACGTACVDLDTSGANCGACGHACGSDQVCSTGSCACAVSGQSLCGSHCADLTSDAANCGACGHACAVGEACSSSVCACATGTQVCTGSTACIDTATDADNCGTCGHACGSGETCNGGSCAAETSAFVQLGGDARHSGFNGGEAGTPPVTAAWVAKLGSGATTPAVIEGGRAFANSGSFLHAVELTNGAEIWSYNFGSAFGVGWPSAGDRALYVATSNNAGDTWFRQIDRGTGAATFKLPFSSQWEHYWSPLIIGSKAYIDGGYGSGLYGFDLTNGGSQIFFDNELEQYDQWSPAAFGANLFTFISGKLRKHAVADGKVQATLDVGWTWHGWSMNTAPVFGDTYAYVISPPSLYAIDPATMKQAWTVNSNYTLFPSVANGVVYALTSGNLRAIDATTGTTLWTFAGDDHLAYPAVVAGGHVYVASANNVYAVNAATHAQEWTAPVGGWLAIGEGVLLVSTPAGTLAAFRLTQ